MNPIEQIRAIDLSAYRASRKMMSDQRKLSNEAQQGMADASRQAVMALRRRAKRILSPHHVEWRDNDGLSINHTDWIVSASIGGEIWPNNPGPYVKQARAHIRFGITARDMDEFDEVCRGLKLSADNLATMLFTKSE